jgi:hypothetical protein
MDQILAVFQTAHDQAPDPAAVTPDEPIPDRPLSPKRTAA